MKQSKLIIILLVFLIACGWLVVLFDSDIGESKEYKEHLETAQIYIEKGLYQKAIEKYDLALNIESSEKIWDLKLDAYQKRYEENTKIYDSYVSSAQSAVSAYPKNAKYAIALANLYAVREEYPSAYKVLETAKESGIDDKELDTLYTTIKYTFEIKWKAYTGYRTCINDFYAVNETGVWTYIEQNGSDTDFERLIFANSVGESGIRLIHNGKRAELVDSKYVVQVIFDFQPSDAGVYSEGFIAIAKDGVYSFYNSMGDKKFGDYQAAGAFVNGKAAVKENDKWYLIDTEGKKISESSYEDIVILQNGTHLYDGVMIAKNNGEYKFYSGGKEIGGYSDVDIITADKIVAVKKDGKWGYVDLNGKEIIAPCYSEAKSFSNGLAAVSNGDKWGFINKDGKIVIDYNFFGADYFNSDWCCMVETGKGTTWQLISLYVHK